MDRELGVAWPAHSRTVSVMAGVTTPAEARSGADACASLRVWVDVENPPQVQYLVPLVKAFTQRGADVYVTARDYGITFDLLRDQGVPFSPVGRHFGSSKKAKIAGTLRRVRELRRLLSANQRPHFVISASRSASLAGRSFRIPSFALCDYEYVNLFAFRFAGTYVVHPDVISADTFRARGISLDRLISYRGIKEDITFAHMDIDAIPPHVFPELRRSNKLRVLVRPPAEESHYHRAESSALGRLALERFAENEDLAVIFSPRYEWQVGIVHSLEWKYPPIVLTKPVSFVSLLKAVDVVVSGGGTMTREAAYLGTPAVSMFRGEAGEVDRYLERAGRLTIVRSEGDLLRLDLQQLVRLEPLYTNRDAANDVVDAVSRAVGRRPEAAVGGDFT